MRQSDANRRPTVLVVDDEFWLRRIFEKVLTEEGYSVVAAQSGPDALSLAASTRPEIILLDIIMPGMDGLATLRELRRRGQDGFVVMLTGRATFDTARQAMLLGADDYITKPFNMALLKSALREGLEERRRAPLVSSCAP